MSSVLNRLTVPSFDLTFLHLANDDSQLPVVLIPGGGGSTKSGVLNQIQIGKYSGSSRGFSLLKPMMTDAEGKSNFCSAIATGFLLSNKQPSICAVMDDICAVFLVSCKEEDYSFEKKVEFKADHHSSFAAVNACLICQGKHIITGGEDGVCRLWVISQGGEGENKGIWEASCVREMKGHTAPIMALALHPFRPWIASASKDGSCKIWDSLNGQELINVPSVDGMDGSKKAGPHASLECRGCVFAPDGRHLYSIQSGKRGPCHIVKWLIDDSTYEAEAVFKISPVAVILASKAPVIKLRISETGNYLATGGSDGRITLFDAEKAKLLQSFPQHDLPVTGLAFAPKAILESSFNENCHAILVSCSADNKLSTVFIRKPSWWPLLAFLVLFLVAALYLYLVSSYEMSS